MISNHTYAALLFTAVFCAACTTVGTPIEPNAPLQFGPSKMSLQDARKKAEAAGFLMESSHYVDRTSVPGIWVVRFPYFKGCSIYFDDSFTVAANHNGERGWKYISNGRPISPTHQHALTKHLYEHLPPGLIPIGTGKGKMGELVLISGVDCEPSVDVEKQLNAQKISYRIMPTALNVANMSYARTLACSTNPTEAWLGDRAGVNKRGGIRASCEYASSDARDFGCMFMGGRTPTGILPDGRQSFTSSQIPDLLK